MGRNRAVVTGIGVVAPNGIGKDAFWRSLLAGESGIRPISLFDASRHPCKIAGEVCDFDPAVHVGRGIPCKRLARQTQLGLAAAFQAVDDAGLTPASVASEQNVPLFLGVSSSAVEVIEHGMARMLARGPARVPTHIVQACQPHQAASLISAHVPLITQSTTISSACAAGLEAIGLAAECVLRGKADVALCGGADAPINPLTYACLAQAGLVTTRTVEPKEASSPFDVRRDSGVISEGAALLVVENLDHARARGARCYLELLGYGVAVDPEEEVPASGLADTMRMALANTGCRACDIDYICAHGPGHPVMDRAETAMIKEVFGEAAWRVPVSSIKGVTGNPLAAAGAMQVVACALAFCEGWIPPTANLHTPDPECDLDYVPREGRRAVLGKALINSHGLGGGNATLIVGRVDV